MCDNGDVDDGEDAADDDADVDVVDVILFVSTKT